MGTATTVAEAVALEAGGVDAVVASGMESGGHRVSFLKPAEESLIGTFALVPQVADAINIPVIAAGGIADRRGYAAAGPSARTQSRWARPSWPPGNPPPCRPTGQSSTALPPAKRS